MLQIVVVTIAISLVCQGAAPVGPSYAITAAEGINIMGLDGHGARPHPRREQAQRDALSAEHKVLLKRVLAIVLLLVQLIGSCDPAP